MALSKTDRTAEVDTGDKELKINTTDYCIYYKKHPYTILWKKECWTCKFADFGIDTGNPTDTGTCKYRKERKNITDEARQ